AAIAVADLRSNGSPDLIVTQAGGAPILLENVGANKNSWIQIDLKGLDDNKNGIGTKVEIFAGGLYQKWEAAGSSGYLPEFPHADRWPGQRKSHGRGASLVAEGCAAG